jgi:hypothetical protein
MNLLQLIHEISEHAERSKMPLKVILMDAEFTPMKCINEITGNTYKYNTFNWSYEYESNTGKFELIF